MRPARLTIALQRALPAQLFGCGLTLNAILGAARLDAEGVRGYGEHGQVITDDNQLLAYGLVRRELVSNRFRAAASRNLLLIRKLSRHRASAPPP